MPRKKPKSSASNGDPAPEGGTQAGAPAVLSLAVMIVVALVAAATVWPGLRLWGLNHLNYYSAPTRTAVLALLAVTFVPAVNRRVYRVLLALMRTIKAGGTSVDLALTAVAVASVVLFWSFRASTNLLGDGQLLAQSWEAAWAGHERVIMRSAGAIISEEQIARGTLLVYYGAARLITSAFDKAPVWAIKLFVCWLGAFFVYFVLGAVRRGPLSPEFRLWLLVVTLFSAAMQLFFGYMENYAVLVFLGFLYVMTAIVVIHGSLWLWLPIVLFIAAFYSHIQAVLLAPSLIYLILWRSMKGRRRFVERYVLAGLTIAMVVVAVGAGFTRIGDYYLPLRGGQWFYGMFSPTHFLDILNEALMLMPAAPLFGAMAWVNRSRGRKAEAGQDRTGGGATGWFSMKAEWDFSLLVLISCFLYLLLFKPAIGMARDWDLFTMTLLGMVPVALLIVNRFFRVTRLQLPAASFTVPAVALSVALSVSWVGVNASPTRTASRFERILVYDQTHASYAYENLAIFYHDRGMLEKATEIMETTCELADNPRQWVRLGMYYEEQGRKDEAIEMMRRVVREHPTSHKARFYLIALIETDPDPDELWALARDGTQYHPNEAIYWFYYGQVSLDKGKVEDGVAALRRCLLLNPPEKASALCTELIQKYSGQQE